MTSTGNSSNSSIASAFKKIVLASILFLIVAGGFTIYWQYYNTYSEGSSSGLLQKFSRKGNFFKTYEGELMMSSIKSNANSPLYSEKFYFSVSDEVLAKQLEDLEGRMVTVHFEQKRKPLFWKGETNHIVDAVKVQD